MLREVKHYFKSNHESTDTRQIIRIGQFEIQTLRTVPLTLLSNNISVSGMATHEVRLLHLVQDQSDVYFIE